MMWHPSQAANQARQRFSENSQNVRGAPISSVSSKDWLLDDGEVKIKSPSKKENEQPLPNSYIDSTKPKERKYLEETPHLQKISYSINEKNQKPPQPQNMKILKKPLLTAFSKNPLLSQTKIVARIGSQTITMLKQDGSQTDISSQTDFRQSLSQHCSSDIDIEGQIQDKLDGIKNDRENVNI